MNVFDYAETILLCGDLKSKLVDGSQLDWYDLPKRSSQRIFYPHRSDELIFSEEQIKFPKKGSMKDRKQRGKALHFFANHELLAIEMMAAAILLFPAEDQSVLKSLVDTISEEQLHLRLYINRMNELGVHFGDFPLNQFFWSFMEKIENIETFYTVISLTFEQANLDFAHYYRELFKELGDQKTSDIMNTIYTDEIKHVARGRAYLAKELLNEPQAESFWEYFLSLLPLPLCADRAKGIIFDEKGRKKAGLDLDYISKLKEYKSSFKITQRKEWK